MEGLVIDAQLCKGLKKFTAFIRGLLDYVEYFWDALPFRPAAGRKPEATPIRCPRAQGAGRDPGNTQDNSPTHIRGIASQTLAMGYS